METEISHSKILHFIEKILKHFSTPVLIMDLSIIEENFNQLKQIKNSKIFYQVKQNSNKYILQFLSDLNSNFDTQSKSEIETILSLGVSPDRISFGNTIKSAEDIKYQYQRGIRLFQVDCEMEIEKIQLYAPESQVFVRIQVPTSQDQDYPLTGKFGTSKEHQVSLVKLQLERKLKPIGVSFHVGSQNYNPESWRIQIKEQSYIFEEIKKDGYNLKMINIGGGLPVRYNKPIPPIEEYIKVINESISEYLGDDIEVFVEPGRSMVGNQGILLTDIILKSKKPDGKEWLYTNLGVFHGLFEITQGVKIPVLVFGKEKCQHKKKFVLQGPTCDSFDIIYNEIELPENTNYKDTLIFLNQGQYTTEYLTRFNGFQGPNIIFKTGLKEIIQYFEKFI